MNEAERFLKSRRERTGYARDENAQTQDSLPGGDQQTITGHANKIPGWFALQGRIGRKTYLSRMLVIIAGIAVAAWLIGIWYGATLVSVLPADTDIESFTDSVGNQIGLLVTFLALPFVIPQDTKRLHDLNMSGWLQLCFPIPLIGWIFRLYVFFRRGSTGPNEYGPQPT